MKNVLLFSLIWIAGASLIGWPSTASARQTDIDALAKSLAPVFDETTIAFAHVDLEKLDCQEVLEQVQTLLPTEEASATQVVQTFAGFQKQATQAGAKHLFVTFSLFDLQSTPVLAVPLSNESGRQKLINAINKSIPNGYQAFALHESGLVVLARTEVKQRLVEQVLRPRQDLAAILRGRLASVASLHLVPTRDHLRVVHELTPPFPKPFDGIDGNLVADGIQSASLSLDSIKPLKMKLRIRSAKRASAQKVADLLDDLKTRLPAKDAQGLVLKGLLAQLKFEIDDKGLELNIGEKEEALWLAVRPFFESARRQVGRGSQTRKLRNLMLGMHNFHDAYTVFPDLGPPASRGKSGLSWRVHILPFIDQVRLYEMFRLDEPWDSEHNRKLIPLIPDLYLPEDPAVEKGRTTLVLPRGKAYFAKPFPTDEERKGPAGVGRRMSEFLDGTSNSIAIVTVAAKNSVVWTKPADWSPDPKQDLLAAFREKGRTTIAVALADGSVRSLDIEDLDPKKFHALLTIAAGELIPK